MSRSKKDKDEEVLRWKTLEHAKAFLRSVREHEIEQGDYIKGWHAALAAAGLTHKQAINIMAEGMIAGCKNKKDRDELAALWQRLEVEKLQQQKNGGRA